LDLPITAPNGQTGRERPQNTWKRDIEKETEVKTSYTIGRRQRQQRKIELNGEEWSVYNPQEVTRLKETKTKIKTGMTNMRMGQFLECKDRMFLQSGMARLS